MRRLLNLPLQDLARAAREAAALEKLLPEDRRNDLSRLLITSPAPEQGLHYFARLAEQHPAAFLRIVSSADSARYIAAVFTHSHFLSEEILEHPAWAAELMKPGALQYLMTEELLRADLNASLSPGMPPPLEFARFRRQQHLRIVIRDLCGLATLPEVTGELTAVADTMVEVAYTRIHQSLVERHGLPMTEEVAGDLFAGVQNEARFCVIALGKMGAEELNYSSDIDLMFLYSGNGETTGPVVITNKEFFKRAANQLTSMLSAYTAEGLCYRVDLRLRPDGSGGEVCISLDAARQYYEKRARDWELQMLIKARVAAGDKTTGRQLLEFVEPLTYASSTDFSVIEQMSATRERLNEKLTSRRNLKPDTIDVKLNRGGIRDIEFLAQCLQRLHGSAEKWVQHRATLLALARLHDKGVLKDAEYGRLASAYQFLRTIEHRLQFDDDRQTHTLPDDPAALELLARRIPGNFTAASLMGEIRMHFANVIQLYERLVHASAAIEPGSQAASLQTAGVLPTLEMRAPALAAALARSPLERGARPFEHFLERISADPAAMDRLNADPHLASAVLDLFEHSPYFGEELIRRPESVVELLSPVAALIRDEPVPAGPAELRRWYRRGILRIEASSLCRNGAVFDTLAETSDLADAVISRAYQIAVDEVSAACGVNTEAKDQLYVIALGRLGMREFDLGSDADLTFVLADEEGAELPFWTRVAERIVQLIGSYTGEGVLFTVDTRLRPNGNSGPLVQTESAITHYFADTAETWESITYLKSRVVAGNRKDAEAFLHELQQVYGTRYGQAGSSRHSLREMRTRIEREQGPSRPFKAGRGGYYDIDFLLLYLRLKNAGLYFSVLNTLERIEVLETMDQLGRADARFLREAATFYRALDHAQRIISGHAEERLPRSSSQLEILNAILPRWTPVPLSDIERIKTETRALFDRFFA